MSKHRNRTSAIPPPAECQNTETEYRTQRMSKHGNQKHGNRKHGNRIQNPMYVKTRKRKTWKHPYGSLSRRYARRPEAIIISIMSQFKYHPQRTVMELIKQSLDYVYSLRYYYLLDVSHDRSNMRKRGHFWPKNQSLSAPMIRRGCSTPYT